ncbi:MAG: hypothetical protein LKI22_00060 [Liquorilactobacillus nagelii]|jgi:hypothetical protein|uniref:hypothetical protein n=1 Tax=Liquorilactobacillus nagelii TaxID=82688 RepID=UPI00242B970D|nr:hypothetical protein [Liquorilactobacillus nagelii]MCI1632357.1 hypothetical protein [Liquorilactobacillus nagelii]
MVLKPLYGSMNLTLAKTIAMNNPNYSKIVEPFGDAGSYALYPQKKPAKQHIVNIQDEEMLAIMQFAQSYSNSDFSTLKNENWNSDEETFNQVQTISDLDGEKLVYKHLYNKWYGMSMTDSDEVSWNMLTFNQNNKNKLFAFSLMKALLKPVEFQNVDPLSLIPSDGFMILIPDSQNIDSVKSKLTSISGQFFFAGKISDGSQAIQDAQIMSNLNVHGQEVASIMMNSYSMITNYDSRLSKIDPANYSMKGGGM